MDYDDYSYDENSYDDQSYSFDTYDDISDDSSNFSYKPSNLLREVYDDTFFIFNLGIPKEKIADFLLFCACSENLA